MTSSSDFKKSPWAKENQHVGYRKSIFSMTPAPEYANSEVLLSSLYRIIGLSSVSEGGVPKAGKDLIARIQKYKERKGNGPDDATIDVDSWGALLQGVLESPKLPNQSSKRFIQVTPLVPSLAIFSGSARLSDNSWPAGSLVRRMVWMGSRDHSSAVALWSDLFQALSVSETDDVFARWLEQEVSRWCPDHNWEFVPFEGGKEFHLDVSDFDSITFMPARAFVKDLRAIIDVKDSMTRRQWTSLLEGVIRIASVSHVIWLCDVQARVWSVLLDALEGAIPSTEFEIRNRIFPSAPRYFPYGSKALNGIKDKVSRYLEARLGINSLFWSIEEAGVHLEGELVSSSGVLKICMAVYGGRPLLAKTGAC